MPTVALQAHFDGMPIVLDEPYDLPANASLMVTLLPSSSDTDPEDAWLRAAASSEAFAFLAEPAKTSTPRPTASHSGMRYKAVLVPFPFDDLSGSKVRPAVCLTDALGVHRHVVIAFITSAVPQSCRLDLAVRTLLEQLLVIPFP